MGSMTTRPAAELRSLSTHLLYEAQMLFVTADVLRRANREGLPLPWALRMATIESFAMHTRVLIEFLWTDPTESRRKRFPNDAFAEDFLPPGRWKTIRDVVPMESTLEGIQRRAGTEIAHLTYNRTADPEERQWEFDRIAGAIGRALRLFLENVDAANLADGFESSLRDTWPEYLNYPIAVSFPPSSGALAVATAPLADMSTTRPAMSEEFLR